MGACAIGQAHHQEALPVVFGATDIDNEFGLLQGPDTEQYVSALVYDILTHLGEPTSPPRLMRARAPPLWEMQGATLGEDEAQPQPHLGKVPRTGSKLREEFDARQILANWAGVDLTRINGLGLSAADVN
jgi:hypothetical protein